MTEYARLEGPYSIPGDKVTFKFKDAFNGSLSFITNSSFGQTEDIKSLLVAMRALHDCCWVRDKVGCNLFGQSRGAAAVANMLAVLNTRTNDWDSGFENIKAFFADEDREQMIMMIKKGVVVLDTPLVTTQVGVKAYAHYVFRGISAEQFLVNSIHDYVLPVVTAGNYCPSGMQALTSVSSFPKDLKLLVSFQNRDEAVGNALDKTFSEKLSVHLNAENVWIVLGDDGGIEIDDETWQVLQKADQEEKLQRRWWAGGLPYRVVSPHRAGLITLLRSGVLNAFFKQHACSYDKDCVTLDNGVEILKRSHCVKDFEEYFKNYDMNNYASRTYSSL
jgi:hypothetical protein